MFKSMQREIITHRLLPRIGEFNGILPSFSVLLACSSSNNSLTLARNFREASRKASLLLDSTTVDETRTPLKLPQFEQAVMIAATKALELWREEALEGDMRPIMLL